MDKKSFFIVILLISIFFVNSHKIYATYPDPQYIFVRKNPMGCQPTDCRMLWNFSQPGGNFVIDYEAGINDILNKVGTRGSRNRKLGVGVNVFYNNYDFEYLSNELPRLLAAVEEKEIPIFIAFDGWKWWSKTPELWNFFDQKSIGYDVNNVKNVEWTCENPSCAISKSWRNWGVEMEIEPHPNLASQKLIEDNKQKLQILLPIVKRWYDYLPPEKKYLLGGITLGIEVDVGGNFFYYPNGISTDKGIQASTQLGYAAINTLGLQGGVTIDNLNQVINSYLNKLDSFAIELGLPRQKIFNHTGAFDIHPSPNLPEQIIFPTSIAAISPYAQPGWSFYGNVADNPASYPSLAKTLESVHKSEWASPEWRSYANNYESYVQALKNSLEYKNNRFINISNWEEIRNKEYILLALNKVLQEPDICWVTAPLMKNVSLQNGKLSFEWEKGHHNEAVYLNISNNKNLKIDGKLLNANVANERVTSINSWSKTNLTNKKYYWQLIADGCGDQRRVTSGIIMEKSVFLPSDLNGDGAVNIFDYNLLLQGFGDKYDIFDYNQLIQNYGK